MNKMLLDVITSIKMKNKPIYWFLIGFFMSFLVSIIWFIFGTLLISAPNSYFQLVEFLEELNKFGSNATLVCFEPVPNTKYVVRAINVNKANTIVFRQIDDDKAEIRLPELNKTIPLKNCRIIVKD
jgi:hypothetical protein